MDIATGVAIPALLRDYERSLWPAVPAAYVLAGLALVCALRPRRRSDAIAAASLVVLWAWTGVAWFLVTVGAIAMQPGWFFGGVFLAQAALIVLALWRGRLRFRFSGDARAWLGAALVADAMLAYPLTGWLSGRPFPDGPMFGLTPWSVVVFTLGMLMLAEPPLPKQLLVFPLLYSLANLPVALRLGPAEDIGMAAAALLAVFVAAVAGFRVPLLRRAEGAPRP